MECNGLSEKLMADFRQLKMQVIRQLKRDLDKANHYFQTEFVMPEIRYDVRGLKAGVAYLQRNEVRFNPILLQENGHDFIRQVVPHELAHILVYQQFGRVAPHGKEWQMMMENVLGVPAEIYHCFDTSSVSRTITYQCDCQIHSLSIRQHNAIQNNKRSYFCKNCKKTLRLKTD